MITEFKEHLLFPTPVYQNNIPVVDLDEIKQEEFREIIPDKNGHYTKNTKILDKYIDLKKSIQEHIDCYVYNHLKIDTRYTFHITNSWVNKHTRDDFANKHFHTHSLISGIYYLQAPKDSGKPVFYNSSTNIMLSNMFDFELTESNYINNSRYTIDIKDGDIIIFPSHLQHSVEKSQTNELRYSLAFNGWVSGQFGIPGGVDELII